MDINMDGKEKPQYFVFRVDGANMKWDHVAILLPDAEININFMSDHEKGDIIKFVPM